MLTGKAAGDKSLQNHVICRLFALQQGYNCSIDLKRGEVQAVAALSGEIQARNPGGQVDPAGIRRPIVARPDREGRHRLQTISKGAGLSVGNMFPAGKVGIEHLLFQGRLLTF